MYEQDGLRSVHNHDFLNDADFCGAYQRGVEAAGGDYHWHWRVHVGLWAASTASKLDGDFVECGVNRGFLSSAIMEYLDWDSLNKTFYLLDTFSGVDERYVTEEELSHGILEKYKSEFFTHNLDAVMNNFAQWENVEMIVGPVPETLSPNVFGRVAYLHLDMNCAPPEVAAFKFFWNLIVPGGVILLDDYAYSGYETQKYALDALAESMGIKIMSLPTGQGLVIKTPNNRAKPPMIFRWAMPKFLSSMIKKN